jgi:UPF0716 protein FxsA
MCDDHNMAKLLLLFIVVPATELALLIEIGSRIGTINTLLLIVVTGVLGASLASHQGLAVLRQIQDETVRGQMPGSAIVDGVIILVAGIVLMTPGILTDILGFLCLIPATRSLIKSWLRQMLERAVHNNRARVVVNMGASETQDHGPNDQDQSWPPSFPHQ